MSGFQGSQPAALTAPAVIAQSAGFRDAAFVCSFGVSGSGKTVDSMSSFPNAVVLAGTREFKSAITTLGYRPTIEPIEVANLFEVEQRADELIKARAQKNKQAMMVDALIVDDFTVLSYQTEQALRDGVTVKGVKLKPKGWDLWTEQRTEVLEISFRIAEKLKQAYIHFVVNGHLRIGRTNNSGKFYRGGIDLPMDMTESFCAAANLMARITAEPERLWQPTVFDITNNDPAWATKNQFNLPSKVPANTRELLNSVGYKMSRLPGMEFHEDFVGRMADYFLKTIGKNPFTKQNQQAIMQGPFQDLLGVVPNPLHARWITRDAVDRAWFMRNAQSSVASELGIV